MTGYGLVTFAFCHDSSEQNGIVSDYGFRSIFSVYCLSNETKNILSRQDNELR